MNFDLYKKGFTLVEMLISMGIVIVIMGAVLYNYGGFNDNLALSGAAQEIATAVRQAQSYGVNVKSDYSGSTYAYGIHFSTIDPTNYYIFADKNSDGAYTQGDGCGGVNTDCVEKVPIRNKIGIASVCNGTSCTPAVGAVGMDITFLRPSTDAKIVFTSSSNQPLTGPNQTGKVILSSASNSNSVTLLLTVENTGQINVGTVGSGPRVCDINQDGHVDLMDLNLIRAKNNQNAVSLFDPFDPNRDGRINVADLRYCQLRMDIVVNP